MYQWKRNFCTLVTQFIEKFSDFVYFKQITHTLSVHAFANNARHICTINSGR